MDSTVVSNAEQRKIIELRFTATSPMAYVVGIAVLRPAPRKTAVFVPILEGSPYGGGHGAGLAADIEDGAVGRVPHHDLAGVADDSLRRFRGNAGLF